MDKIGQEEIQQMVEMKKAGKTYREIGEHFGKSLSSIHRIISDRGDFPYVRRGMLSQSELEDMEKLYKSGWKLRQLGERFNIYHNAVRKHLIKRKVYQWKR